MQEGELASFQPLPELMVQISLACGLCIHFICRRTEDSLWPFTPLYSFTGRLLKLGRKMVEKRLGSLTRCAAASSVQKVLPSASFQLLFNPFSHHLWLLKHKDWISANCFWKQLSTWVERSKVTKLSRIHIRKRDAPHFTSHHHLKVKFPSIVINARSYPAWRIVLHFQHVTLSGKIDHQTAPQSPHCVLSLQRRGSEGASGAWGVSFHVFHCGWWLCSLKRPIKQEDWKQSEEDPFDYLQRPLLELFYGGDGWLVALWAPGSLRFFVVFLLADCFGTHKTFKNGHMQLNISLFTKWQ